ncbi:hypothetical protein ALCH109712_07750 [Alkalicoccus chagannorensis]
MKYNGLEITPLEVDVNVENYRGLELRPSSEATVITLRITNHSQEEFELNRDFYYSFGLVYEHLEHADTEVVARLDIEDRPWEYPEGSLEIDESVTTEIGIFTGEPNLIELIFDENFDQNEFEENRENAEIIWGF